MSMNSRLLKVMALSVGVILGGCGGDGGGSTKPVISVSLSPATSQAIDQGQTIHFTANVVNDLSSSGVTWSQSGQGALSSQTSGAATFTGTGAAGSATVTATAVADTSKNASTSISITPVPAITTRALNPATLGTPYSQPVAATGGAGTLMYSVSAGTLPVGLALNTSTGAITGTPSGSPGASNFTVQVADSSTAGALTATQALSIVVTSAVPPLSITTTPLPNGSVGGSYSWVLQSTGGTGKITWSVTPGSLPVGLTLDATGAITGIPTAAGTSSITFQAKDSGSPQQTASATLSLTIAQLMITTTSLLNPMVGETYNQTLQYTDNGGTLPVVWSVPSGALPAGLSLIPNTGAITGKATAPGNATFTVQATDSSAPTPQTATQQLSLTVTSANACGSGSEALLAGQYAMSLTGFDASGPVGILVSFTADGTGKITSGYEDINSTGAIGVHANVAVVPAGSSYSLGPDRRGCLTLVTSLGTTVFHIAVGILNKTGVATNGRSIEFDATGTNVAGTIQIQDTTAFSNAQLTGNYAFIVQSPLTAAAGGGFFAAVGTLNLSGTAVTGSCDMNFNGTMDPGNSGYPGTPMTLSSGTYSVGSNGRGTLSFTVSISGTPTTINTVIYVLNATQMYLMTSDPQSATKNLFDGFAGQQTGLPYSTASLSSANVLFASGQTSSPAVASRVEAGVFTPDGAGDFTFSGDRNNGGTVSTVTQSGTHTVSSNGRVLVTNSGATTPARVMYMLLSGWAYSLSTDNNVMIGDLEPQSGEPFTNASLSGTFSFGTIVPVVPGSPLIAGEAIYDGAGNVNITYDVNEGGFLSLDNVVTETYSASPNGRVVTPSGGTTFTVSYIRSSGTVISFGYTSTDTDPTLRVMDQ